MIQKSNYFNSNKSLSLMVISVLLLSSFLIFQIPAAKATTVFSSDFENATHTFAANGWTGIGGSGTSIVASDQKNAGSYSGKFTLDGSGNEAFSYISVAGQSDVYVKFAFRSDTPTTAWTNRNIIRLKGDGSDILYFGTSEHGAGEISRLNPNVGASETFGTWAFSVNTWYSVKVHFVKSATVGVIQVWVDGVSTIDLTGLDTSAASPVDEVDLGSIGGQYFAANHWVDDVSITTTDPDAVAAESPVYLSPSTYTIGRFTNGTYYSVNASLQTAVNTTYASGLLNTAISRISASGSYGIINVRDGHYLLGETVVPKSNVYLNISQGAILYQNTLSALGNSFSLMFTSNAISNWALNGNGGAILEGNKTTFSDHRDSGTWSGNFYKYFGFGIYSDSVSSNITVKNIIVKDIVGQNSFRSCQNSLVDNLTVINAGDNPITMEALSEAFNSNSTVQNCNVTYGQDVGINTFHCSNTTIQNNYVSDILNFTGASHWGIAAENSVNVIIKGNHVSNTEENIVSVADDCTIKDNIVTGTGNGIHLLASNNNLVQNNTVNVTGNSFATYPQTDTKNAQVINNTFSGDSAVIMGYNTVISGGSINASTSANGALSLRNANYTDIRKVTFYGTNGILDYSTDSHNIYISQNNFASLTGTRISLPNSINVTIVNDNVGYNTATTSGWESSTGTDITDNGFWTEPTAGSATMMLNSTFVKSGSYSLQQNLVALDNGKCLEKTFNAQTSLNATFYFATNTTTPTWLQDCIFSFGGGSTPIGRVWLGRLAGSPYIQITYDYPTSSQVNYTWTPTVDHYYLIEVDFNKSATKGFYTLEIDGVQVMNVSANTASAPDITYCDLGGSGYQTYATQNNFDDFTYSTYQIGSSPSNYYITSSSDVHSSITPSGLTTVTSGSDQSFTFTANTDYSIQNVFVDGISVLNTGSYVFSTVIANHTISITSELSTTGNGNNGNNPTPTPTFTNSPTPTSSSNPLGNNDNMTLLAVVAVIGIVAVLFSSKKRK